MSGGVDSSAAALLLQKQGYECAGATMKLYSNEDICMDLQKTCCSADDVFDARSVAARLNIPFYVFYFVLYVLTYFYKNLYLPALVPHLESQCCTYQFHRNLKLHLLFSSLCLLLLSRNLLYFYYMLFHYKSNNCSLCYIYWKPVLSLTVNFFSYLTPDLISAKIIFNLLFFILYS